MEINQPLIDKLVAEWIDIGLDKNPIDFEACKPIINEIYQNVNFDPPEFFFYAPSPIEGIKMYTALNQLGYKAVCEADDPQTLVERVAAKIEKVEFNNQICYGNHEASILAFYQYFIEEGTVDNIDNIKPFIEFAKVGGWWIPTRKAVILMERPSKISLDERGLTHCEDGPAISFQDSDFDVYIWHGTRIPDEWIRDNALTPEICLTWDNTEQRRCACEIYGWHNVLKELDSRIVDENTNPQIGTLVEVDLPDLGTERFLLAECGTKREFAIPVPIEMETAHEANSWSYGLSIEEYQPEVRT